MRFLYEHDFVSHSAGEYVKEQAHIDGVESFWATLKRAHKGVYHKIGKKHLHRCVKDFAGRHGLRGMDTVDQMDAIVCGFRGKILRQHLLTA